MSVPWPPAVVIPMHDPDGLMLPHLEAITGRLKSIFVRAFVSATAETIAAHPAGVSRLQRDAFFKVVPHPEPVPVGEDFLTLYQTAAAACPAGQVLHLCFIDRLAYALQSHHEDRFIADIQAVGPEESPLIFRRSARAWQTHPANYYELEMMINRVGEMLFGRLLDFPWCHLAITAGRLGEVLPGVRSRDLSLLAEIVLSLRDELQMKDVDWLAWEDPFILGRDPAELKAAREASVVETRKRLSYLLPMLRVMASAADKEA